MRYLYTVAGLRLLCSIPFPLTIQEEAREFLHLIADDAAVLRAGTDLTFTFQAVPALPPIGEGAFFTQNRFYDWDGEIQTIHHCPAPGMEPYACVTWEAKDRVVCRYLPGSESRMCYSRNISDLLGAETLLMRFGGLMLHASFIRWKGRGILFSAPSGTGKSTQAELWLRYEGAEILNGDRTALRKDASGCWRAYGLPYAGSSGIYRNESAPVWGVVVLAQAKENRVCRLPLPEAVRRLYPEAVLHHWDRRDVEEGFGLLSELAAGVPVIRLECRPDRDAVLAVRDALTSLNEKGGICQW